MPKNAYKPTLNDIFPGKGDAAVGQDKIGPAADREASAPPERGAQELRSDPGKLSSSQSGARVPVTAHIKPEVKAELARLARQGKKKGEWLSLSQTASALLEKGIQGTIDMQYGTLLKPIIEKEIKKGLQSFSNRSTNLAVRAFYSAEQTRILVITLLSYLLGDQTEILPGLISQAQKEAHANLQAQILTSEEAKASQP